MHFDLSLAGGQGPYMGEGEPSGLPGDSVDKRPDMPFELTLPDAAPLPILIAAPHGGRAYPAPVMENFRSSDTHLRLEDRHIDTLAIEITRQTGAGLLVAHTPRAVIDLNRAPDDVDWTMVSGAKKSAMRHSLANRRARSGLGLVPRRLSGVGEIWRRPLTQVELDERIETVHRPYHQALGLALEQLRDRWGAALLIDLHSMPPLRRRHMDEIVPEFVIGDRFGASCDGRLVSSVIEHFNEAGRPASHNRPYSGGYVLDRHGAPRRGIHAIQIEVCRSTYLDPRLVQPGPRMATIAKLLARLVRRLARQVAEIGGDATLPQAAE